MKFRLSDERVWTWAFTANSPIELVSGIASAWDARIEAVSRAPGEILPEFALAARLEEIDRWEAERASREAATPAQRSSWKAQAEHWRTTARAELGGSDSSSPLHLHVWSGHSWVIPCSAYGDPAAPQWRGATRAPQVARLVALDRAAQYFAGAQRIIAYIGDSAADIGPSPERPAPHPRPAIVREMGEFARREER